MSENTDYKRWEQGRRLYTYYQRMGFIDGYEIIGSGDTSQCETCTMFQGKYRRVSTENPLPKFHPNCRCYVKLKWKKLERTKNLIYPEFFNKETGRISKIGRGAYIPTPDLIVEAINALLKIDITWNDILQAGIVGENAPLDVYDAECLVGKEINLEKLIEIHNHKAEIRKILDSLSPENITWAVIKVLQPTVPLFKTILENVEIKEKTLDAIKEYQDKTKKILGYYKELDKHKDVPDDEIISSTICERKATLQKKALDSLLEASIEMLMGGEEIGIKIGDPKTSSYRDASVQKDIIEIRANERGWEYVSDEDKNREWSGVKVESYPEYDEDLVKKWRWLNRRVDENGDENLNYDKDFPVALPDVSNHQDGLAIDLYPFQDWSVPEKYIKNHAKPYLEKHGWEQSTIENDQVHFNYVGDQSS